MSWSQCVTACDSRRTSTSRAPSPAVGIPAGVFRRRSRGRRTAKRARVNCPGGQVHPGRAEPGRHAGGGEPAGPLLRRPRLRRRRQDTRGRYDSEGVWHMLTDDGPRRRRHCAWIGKQPWSNGKVGMIGTSYVGGTQHALAHGRRAGAVTVDPGRRRVEHRAPGHAQRRRVRAAVLELDHAHRPARAAGSRSDSPRPAAARRRWRTTGAIPAEPAAPPRHHAAQARRPSTKTGWSRRCATARRRLLGQNNIIDHPDRYKDIPVYLVGGWYDSWAGNTTANFTALTQGDQEPGLPDHGPVDSRPAGQVTPTARSSFGPDAAIADPLAWRLSGSTTGSRATTTPSARRRRSRRRCGSS